jgi:hypothetical protein
MHGELALGAVMAVIWAGMALYLLSLVLRKPDTL